MIILDGSVGIVIVSDTVDGACVVTVASVLVVISLVLPVVTPVRGQWHQTDFLTY